MRIGSRAAATREPRQVRKEAALSAARRVPRIGLVRADRSGGPTGVSVDRGCTANRPGRCRHPGRRAAPDAGDALSVMDRLVRAAPIAAPSRDGASVGAAPGRGPGAHHAVVRRGRSARPRPRRWARRGTAPDRRSTAATASRIAWTRSAGHRGDGRARSPFAARVLRSASAARATSSGPMSTGAVLADEPASTTTTSQPWSVRRRRTKSYSTPLVSSVPEDDRRHRAHDTMPGQSRHPPPTGGTRCPSRRPGQRFVTPGDVETMVFDWGTIKWLSEARVTGSGIAAGVVILGAGQGS